MLLGRVEHSATARRRVVVATRRARTKKAGMAHPASADSVIIMYVNKKKDMHLEAGNNVSRRR